MGTRAAFFIGDPRKPDAREWLGCIAWDGYIDGVPEMAKAKTEKEFFDAVKGYSSRDDFAKPTGAFPYPWNDDLFLTDCVYAWFEGEIWTEINRSLVPLSKFMELIQDDNAYDEFEGNNDCENIPAPGTQYDGSSPDSIMILTATK